MCKRVDELISRERALEALGAANVRVTGMRVGKTILAKYAEQVREGYIDILREVPAAVVEVVHEGYWIDCGKTEKGTPIRRCSYCGTEKAGRPLSAYCPDCGARMFGRMSMTDGVEELSAVRVPFVHDEDEYGVTWESINDILI